jgi:hypothetical protein
MIFLLMFRCNAVYLLFGSAGEEMGENLAEIAGTAERFLAQSLQKVFRAATTESVQPEQARRAGNVSDGPNPAVYAFGSLK